MKERKVKKITNAKGAFLTLTGASNKEICISKSLNAALGRNKTYNQGVSALERKKFRYFWQEEIKKYAGKYVKQIPSGEHNKTIIKICKSITKKYRDILHGERLRVGTSQKAFNLYLKYLWCLDNNRPSPPHCPVDRIILERSGIYGVSWTKLDSIDEYSDLINRLKKTAKGDDFNSLQEWELWAWNQLVSHV